MKVRFYATLRELAGGKTFEFALPPGTPVHALLARILEEFPAMREELFNERGELWPHVHVFLDGRDAPHLENGLDTRLAGTETLDVFPAVAGG